MTQRNRHEVRSLPALDKKHMTTITRSQATILRFGASILSVLSIFALLALLPVCMQAQVLYGTLVGNVTDQNGAAVVGATIVATNTGKGISKTVSTDSSGIYRIIDLDTRNLQGFHLG
jgi:hypothetical protein